MIIVNLKGGLGNQMFQYALGRRLTLQNKDTLKLDTTGLARANNVGDIYRPFALDAFAIEKEIATAEEIKALKYPYGIISKGLRRFRFKVLKQTNTLFIPKMLHVNGNLYLDGYWQSPRYFDDIRDTLLHDFTLNAPLSAAGNSYATQMKETVSVSIHVRRGDYIKNPRVLKEFGICSLEYYKKAIAHIERTYTKPTYFVFSDDIAWVKENVGINGTAIFVSDPTINDTSELALMSTCKHNIIANSSFSWWGAWLNQNPEKIVVAPAPWFELEPYDTNLIPPTWTQLPKS